MLLGKVPDPFGSIADDDLLRGTAPTPLPVFEIKPLAKLMIYAAGLWKDTIRFSGLMVRLSIEAELTALLSLFTSATDAEEKRHEICI